MEVLSDLERLRELRRTLFLENRSVGFVPTMGALHEGHLSLIRRCKAENQVTIVSIFVNPTQFDDRSDFNAYPQVLEKDKVLLSESGTDYVLLPTYKTLYPDDYRYRVTEDRLSHILCGKHRPGHFDGVLTVVLKLFNLVRPHRAYFGEKDYQQMILIRDMALALFLDIEIVACPTIRERDGLAMSSRNTRLSPHERKQASDFSKLLAEEGADRAVRDRLIQAGFEVDYVESHFGRRLGAVHLGNVRLIDNVEI